MWRSLAAVLDGTLTVAKWLVLPISLLLFLQWPLREVVQQGSREANDLGQWLFALYVAVAVAAATRGHGHLTAGSIATGYSAGVRRTLRIAGSLLGVLPWLAFIAWSGRNMVLSSVAVLERFPDTGNPGYYVIKLALLVLVLTLLLASILDMAGLDMAGDSASDREKAAAESPAR